MLTSLAAAPAQAPAARAADPLVDRQWALGEKGGLGVRSAWRWGAGEGIVVAVVDTGVDLGHRDLRSNIWTNPGEVARNGRDDDRNGWVDDVHGLNAVQPGTGPRDDSGHGTHVAGIIAARAGNHRGVAGVAGRARIMAVKVLDHRRRGRTAILATGIRYAAENGARIINVSINADERSRAVDAALERAEDLGALVVASAGNDHRDLDIWPSYPAAHPSPAVISVAAGTTSRRRASYSNWGRHTVDLLAPGHRIFSTRRGGGYATRSGTSMAAPHVSGALALLAGARPSMSARSLRIRLMASARRSAHTRRVVRSGSLRIGNAVRAAVARRPKPR